MKTCIRTILLIIVTLALTSCSTGPNTSVTLSANDYLQMAANSSGTERQQLQLQAAARYIDAGHLSSAQTLLNNLNNVLLAQELITTQQLLQARIDVANHNNSLAIQRLHQLDNSHLSQQQRAQQLNLMAKAYEQQGNLVASIQQRTQLLSLESGSKQKQTLIDIWLSLQTVSQQQLSRINNASQPSYLQGWLSLNAIINRNDHDATPTVVLLSDWQQRYPGHPANALLPKSLTPSSASQQPHHIALLLPLSGEYANNAQAIRNGFFTAYYYAKQHTRNPPTVTVVDTSHQAIGAAYRSAIQQGADFIVGPLTKSNLATLVRSEHIDVPTLALNTLPNARSVDNLYQFGLSPYDEVNQLIAKAQQAQHNRAIIITPNDTWGQSISNNLAKQWQQQGGKIIASLNYTSRDQLSNDIKQLFNVQDSYSRGYAIRSILNTKDVRIVSRRRQDFDSIFLIAQPTMARQIQPLLKFYFAGDIPVYATSQLYEGQISPNRDRDLDDIFFCDMPWVLEPQQMHPTFLNTLQKQSKNVWPTSYQNEAKLYALGVDAYRLTTNLNTMKLLPDFGTKAATGTLYLDSNNHIYRQLMWAQFVNGKPKLTS